MPRSERQSRRERISGQVRQDLEVQEVQEVEEVILMYSLCNHVLLE